MKRTTFFLLLGLLPACATPRKARIAAAPAAGPRTFYGVLPCQLDCQHVRTELTIMDSHRFAMEETFRTRQGAENIEQSWGEWAIVPGHGNNPKAQVYELTSDQFEQEKYFLRVGADALRALDDRGAEISTKDNVMLKRIKNK